MSSRKLLASPKAKEKISRTMKEFKAGKLKSGSKKGPRVTDKKQALAISLNQARRAVKE